MAGRRDDTAVNGEETNSGLKAVLWLRDRNALLPGATTLTRLVATVRDAATQRLWATLCNPLSTEQQTVLDAMLIVGDANRTSDWIACAKVRFEYRIQN